MKCRHYNSSIVSTKFIHLKKKVSTQGRFNKISVTYESPLLKQVTRYLQTYVFHRNSNLLSTHRKKYVFHKTSAFSKSHILKRVRPERNFP